MNIISDEVLRYINLLSVVIGIIFILTQRKAKVSAEERRVFEFISKAFIPNDRLKNISSVLRRIYS